jgi:hypothetical protein
MSVFGWGLRAIAVDFFVPALDAVLRGARFVVLVVAMNR